MDTELGRHCREDNNDLPDTRRSLKCSTPKHKYHPNTSSKSSPARCRMESRLNCRLRRNILPRKVPSAPSILDCRNSDPPYMVYSSLRAEVPSPHYTFRLDTNIRSHILFLLDSSFLLDIRSGSLCSSDNKIRPDMSCNSPCPHHPDSCREDRRWVLHCP